MSHGKCSLCQKELEKYDVYYLDDLFVCGKCYEYSKVKQGDNGT